MDNNGTQGNHSCSMCQGHGTFGDMCGHRHWAHIIIKILIAVFIFWCGVQFGELKSLIHSQFSNYGMMGWAQDGNQTYFRGPGMMYGGTFSVPAQAVTETTTVKPTTTTK